MQTGRPVLIRSTTASELTLDHALIGWKDTRETRVSIVEIAPEDDPLAARKHVADVVTWLGRHSIRAEFNSLAEA